MSIDPERYRDLFQTEAEEHLAGLTRELLRLEADPAARDALAEAFRSLHTLKGMSAAMGFTPLAALAHVLEGLCESLLRGSGAADARFFELAFAAVDALANALPDRATESSMAAAERVAGQIASAASWDSGGVPPRGDGPGRAAAADGAQVSVPPTGAPQIAGEPRGVPAAPTVRIRRDLLDRLLNEAGELVLTTQRLEDLERGSGSDVRELARRAAALAARLQATVLTARMVPAGTIFQRFPRAIRDQAARSGKLVNFVTSGAEIELDRAILDQVADPLMHLLRNAVDHGIEPPAERELRRKPRSGTVTLAAFRDGPNVVLEVSDDGRGLDRARLREAARARGVDANRLADLSEADVDRLALLTGLTTAEMVSHTSGRGIGLDAVQAAVTRLGGVLAIRSAEGAGATFSLRVPGTLAVVPSLVVESSGSRYAIPMGYVREVVRPAAGAELGNEVTLASRGERLTARPLADVLRSASPACAGSAAAEVREPGGAVGIVLELGEESLAVHVERVVGSRELLVRPLPPLRGTRSRFSGGAILSDGTLALVVDVAGILLTAPRLN